jgi:hypothetical protein
MLSSLPLLLLALSGGGLAPEASFELLLPTSAQVSGRPSSQSYSNLRASFEAGPRSYGSSWGKLDSHGALGFTFAQEPPGWLLGWDAGIFWSNDSGAVGPLELKINTWELYGGVMKTLHLIPHRLRFELGAGVAMNYLYAHDRDAIGDNYQDDFYMSSYGRAGLNLRVGGTSWVGVGGRAARGGDARLFGNTFEGDYEQVTFTLSNSW